MLRICRSADAACAGRERQSEAGGKGEKEGYEQGSVWAVGKKHSEGGREGWTEKGREIGREAGWNKERVESCFLNLNTCVGRVQATDRNVYHRHLHGCSIPLWNIRPGHEFKGICTMIR